MPAADIAMRYRVKVNPKQQQLQVTLTVDLPQREGPLTLSIPTWAPGAYAFMRYARDLFDLEARDVATDERLTVTREGWSSFRIDGGKGAMVVRYRVTMADEAWGELCGVLDDRRGVLLGTYYLFAPQARNGACEVTFELPDDWAIHACAGATPTGQSTYWFPDHTTLFDTPIVMGEFEKVTREVQGVSFHCIFLDRTVGFEKQHGAFVDALMRVAEGTHAIFGSFPFESYSFVITFAPDAGWGLEHASSTMIALGPHVFIDESARFDGIRVAAHELFHAWNVCRLKPSPLGKLDPVGGNFTDALWVSEGFTRYFEFVLAARAGECSADTFFSNVVNYYRHLEAMPAYARTTPVDSSRATFLNHGKYPGSINNTIDYYDHGMLVAFDLDAVLRGVEPPGSLEATFKAFYEKFVGQGDGFTSAQFRDFVREHSGPQAGQLVGDETEKAGRLSTVWRLEDLGFSVRKQPFKFLGLVLDKNTGPKIVNVLDTSPAGQAGLTPGDIITEVQGHPFDLKTLQYVIKEEHEVVLTVRRASSLRRYVVKAAEREQIHELIWAGSDAHQARIRSWLGQENLAWEAGHRVPLGAFDNFHGIQKVL